MCFVSSLDTSATDTDPEEPANALASLGRRPVQVKTKTTKQKRISKSVSRERGTLKTTKLARSMPHRKEKKFKLVKKEKENVKDISKKQKVQQFL